MATVLISFPPPPASPLNAQITTGDINFYAHGGPDLGYDADTGAIPPISTNMPISALLPWY